MISLALTLGDWFGLPPAAARVAARLYLAGGETVHHATLMVAAGQTRNGVDLSIKFLRAAMDAGSVENVPRQGFRLSAVGLRDCDRGLAEAAGRRGAA